jgi:hypothetical protein
MPPERYDVDRDIPWTPVTDAGRTTSDRIAVIFAQAGFQAESPLMRGSSLARG